MRRSVRKFAMRLDHTKVKVGAMNNVDPDDGNRWVCNACRLPIFFTPFVGDGDDPNHISLVMHVQCADQLPAKIEDHPLHLSKELTLFVDADNIKIGKNNCSRCGSMCGTKFYACATDCGFTLDLTCALSIKVAHRSHPHRLTATRGRSCSFICHACGIQHRPLLGLEREAGSAWDLFYVCSICDFWIHPDCALLPNAIVVDKRDHPHPLLLGYGNRDIWRDMIFSGVPCICAICDGKSDGIGWYECLHCRYSVHVKCIAQRSLKQVLLRDAQIPGLLRLPMQDEHQNLMASIMNTYEDTPSTSTITDGASTSTSTSTTCVDGHSEDNKVHEHPLIFHDHLQNDRKDIALVCDACVRIISPSDSFYSCHELSCTGFVLHDCCAHLPLTLFNQTIFNHEKYPSQCQGPLLSLLPKPLTVTRDSFGMFTLEFDKYGMHKGVRLCNGFVYSCNGCRLYLDVLSALMPASITHEAHSKSHILRKTNRTTTCSFCGMSIIPDFEIAYECNNGCDFFVHTECAILPGTVSHDFDPHPLKLMPYNTRQPQPQQEEEEIPFCEICENDIDNKGCYYGCSTCKHTFHTECFPYFDQLSKIKFGFTVQVTCHDCPLACVRAHPLVGYKCIHCKLAITERDKMAFECAECYLWMHKECAEKLMLKS